MPLLRDVGDGVEADGQAQGVGLTDDASHCAFGVLFGEVVATEVVVADVVGEHVPDGGQDGVLDGDDRLLFAQAWYQTGIGGAQVGAFPCATHSPENEPAPSYATSGMGSKRTVRPRALA